MYQLHIRYDMAELTGENFTRGHFSHWQQSFNWRLCLQLCSPLVMNNSLSWSIHLLMKSQEEQRLTPHFYYITSTWNNKSKNTIIYLLGQLEVLIQSFTLSALPSSRHRLAAITGWFISMYTCKPFVHQHYLTVSVEMWIQDCTPYPAIPYSVSFIPHIFSNHRCWFNY